MIDYHLDRRDGARGTVVLAGSLGSTAELWRPQRDALAAHFDILRIEHPGHGGPAGPNPPETLAALVAGLIEVLDAERIDRAQLVGISLGGMLALATALDHPERVDRVIALCTAAAFDAPDYWHDRADRVLRDGPDAVAPDIVSRWFTESFARDHPDVVRRMITMIGRTDPAGYAGCCRAIARMDLRPRLPGLTTPVLAVAGAEDRTTPPERLQLIADLAPAGECVTLPGAHLITVENPTAVNRLILDRLTGDAELPVTGDRL